MRALLAAHGSGPGRADAAVALLLRPDEGAWSLLLVRRAERPGDPWSGHAALPGGFRQPRDADDRATAVRETREEVGIDLSTRGEWLGALEAVRPRRSPVPLIVAPHIFAVHPYTEARPNAEIAEARWVPLDDLLHPGARTTRRWGMDEVPALCCHNLEIWGMTLRILEAFFRLWSQACEPATPVSSPLPPR